MFKGNFATGPSIAFGDKYAGFKYAGFAARHEAEILEALNPQIS